MFFKEMGIEAIEAIVENEMNAEVDAQRTFINALHYLQTSKRYKENRVYGKSTFREYLKMRFNMPQSRYEEMKRVYVSFANEAEEHGVGFVSDVVKKCGSVGAIKVFDALKEEQAARKKPISMKRKHDIVAQYTPSDVMKSERNDWRGSYLLEVEKNRKLMMKLAEKDEQIERLKETVKRLENGEHGFRWNKRVRENAPAMA